MFDLDGKTAWVTGSTHNLGRAMIEGFASQGADVVVSNHSDRDVLEEAVNEIRDDYDVEVYGIQLDVRDEESVINSVESIRSEFNTVDILVNNVGIRPHESFDDITAQQWDNVIRTNLTGAFYCSKHVAPDMIDNQWGRLINISGVDAYLGTTDRLHGVSTKAGLIGMSRALASQLGRHEITSNCIVPGVFDTDRDPSNYPNLEQRYEVWRQRAPVGRLGEPKELASAAVFLASKEASFVTGQVLHVNGGLYPTTMGPGHLNRELS